MLLADIVAVRRKMARIIKYSNNNNRRHAEIKGRSQANVKRK